MARASRFDFLFDPLENVARGLEAFGGQARVAAEVEAVNEVTSRFDVLARRGQNEGLNLTDEYVKSKTDVRLATTQPLATITTRGDLTIMSRYPYMQIWRPAKSSKAKGDAKRGVPPGARAAGVRLDIAKGRPQYEPKLFTMQLRRGTQAGDNVGVFVRTSAGRVKHLYGPSPYSLFRFQVERRRDDLTNDLARTALERIGDALERGL